MQFENTYTGLPDRFYARVRPAVVPKPTLLAWNPLLAGELGLCWLGRSEERFSRNAETGV